MAPYAKTLRPASWRGVPFGVEAGSATVGRRKVQHDYPYRDTVWLEDQGRLPRSFRLLGFLIGDSAIYGGGSVQSQRKRMESAAEATGSGILVHPSRGRITVDLLDLVITERWDEGNYLELQFTFVQGGTQLFPSVLGALGDLVKNASALADAAHLGAFTDAITGPLQQGLAAASSLASTATAWIDKVSSLARDATSLYGTVSQLGGEFGRYFHGRNSGFLEGLVSPYSGAGSVTDLINLGASLRGKVETAAADVRGAIAGLGVTTAPTDIGAAIQAHVAALEASASDPADGIRLLGSLAKFSPSAALSMTATGGAACDLYRRSAVAALSRASAAYAPASADDASAARMAVLSSIDAEISVAGDQHADEVFGELRSLRRTVVEDLGSRGASLARLTDILSPIALPAVSLAQRQYGDATRAAELVTQADPPHPWFMPTKVRALGS